MNLSEKRKKLKQEILMNKGEKIKSDFIEVIFSFIENQDKEFIKDILEVIPYKKTSWAKLMRLKIINKAGEELASPKGDKGVSDE